MDSNTRNLVELSLRDAVQYMAEAAGAISSSGQSLQRSDDADLGDILYDLGEQVFELKDQVKEILESIPDDGE